ncbi:MAG: hypothetical protein WCS94_22190, partial [Verrucomicrobiota bacterium]
SETYERTAQTVWHVQTGGKAVPGLLNLCQFSGSATEIVNKRGPSANDKPIPYDQIAIGSMGNLGTNGVRYNLLPNDRDFDITPTVANLPFYTFSVSGQKFLSYFEVFVRMPDPAGTANYTGSGFSRDYGHAYWCLSSDAPMNALVQQLKAAGLNTNAVSQFNVQEGYGPVGSSMTFVLADLDFEAPGQVYVSSGGNTNRIYQIGFNGLLTGLNWAQYLSDHPGTYGARYHNCAEELESLGALVGVPLPNTRYPEVLGHQLPPNN